MVANKNSKKSTGARTTGQRLLPHTSRGKVCTYRPNMYMCRPAAPTETAAPPANPPSSSPTTPQSTAITRRPLPTPRNPLAPSRTRTSATPLFRHVLAALARQRRRRRGRVAHPVRPARDAYTHSRRPSPAAPRRRPAVNSAHDPRIGCSISTVDRPGEGAGRSAGEMVTGPRSG
jgi:hypothetical protein